MKMVSSVRLRPNHYETLGLSPTASQEEITRTFAKVMGVFGARSVAGAAQMIVAFEALRSPAKRRAYDSALGLTSEPDPSQWTVAGVARGSPGFLGSASGHLTEHVVGDKIPRTVPAVEPQPVAPSEPRFASFLASSLREPARPSAPGRSPDVRPKTEIQRPREEPAGAGVELGIQRLLAARRAEERSSPDAVDRILEWQRPALAIGGLAAAAILIGVLLGVSVTNNEQPQPAERGVTVALPAATSHPGSAALSPGPVATVVEKQDERPLRARISAPPTKHKVSQPQPTSFAEHQVDVRQSPEFGVEGSPSVGVATDQLTAESAPATPVAANLPLPNRVIARTIERIGYSCGAVVSTAPVGSNPGAYTVTCSSGQIYEANPVHGRYHFRRSGGH